MKTWANPSIEEMQKEAKKLSQVWQIDRMEQLLNIIPTCEVCGSEAVQRCSQDRMEIIFFFQINKVYNIPYIYYLY